MDAIAYRCSKRSICDDDGGYSAALGMLRSEELLSTLSLSDVAVWCYRFLQAVSFVRTPEDTVHAPATWYVMYTGLGHPFLMMLLFGSCALAGW